MCLEHKTTRHSSGLMTRREYADSLRRLASRLGPDCTAYRIIKDEASMIDLQPPPQPRQPREWWMVLDTWKSHAFETKESAANFNYGFRGQPPIKVREVIE